MKKYKNSMVMGNFCPFHNGHKYLIDTSIENSEKVYVFVCHRKDDPISGNERFLSIKNTYRDNENIIVFNIEHDYDNYPGERGSTVDEFYDYWVNQIVYKYVDELDVVFTSEEYGDEFAEYLGVEHFLVDKKRKEYPISGTEIRNNP
ncbi:MAG: adenylyltransferase/cytidyltransferase family protein, partial [Candidatus Riesia sp.]|nr:adenylyltransferase/cytidyltransferase family protein [Candidatus Riesia sp.]